MSSQEFEVIVDLGAQERRSHQTMGVYFIACGRFIKVGFSDQVKKRLATLRGSTPFNLKPLGWIQCDTYTAARELEADLHLELSAYRHRHEWFHDNADIRAIIAERAQEWPL